MQYDGDPPLFASTAGGRLTEGRKDLQPRPGEGFGRVIGSRDAGRTIRRHGRAGYRTVSAICCDTTHLSQARQNSRAIHRSQDSASLISHREVRAPVHVVGQEQPAASTDERRRAFYNLTARIHPHFSSAGIHGTQGLRSALRFRYLWIPLMPECCFRRLPHCEDSAFGCWGELRSGRSTLSSSLSRPPAGTA